MEKIGRYHRQQILPEIGARGQELIEGARVVIVGCGALGCGIAEQLVRAGVGRVRIADRDLVEMTNLQRQVLFDEADARAGMPKAVAAVQRLREINSEIEIEAAVADVDAGNVEKLIEIDRTPADVIFDGTDNVETRYLLNDVAVKRGSAWVYAGCVGMEVRAMGVRPGKTACLRCLFPQAPAAEELGTCDTVGVLGAAAAIAGALAVTEGLRLLVDSAAGGRLVTGNVWQGRFHTVMTERDPECVTCGQRRFEFLDEARPSAAISLCGRDAVQIKPAGRWTDLGVVAERLAGAGELERTPYFVRCRLAGGEVLLTAFADGRLLVAGTRDIGRAKSIYARYFGS